MKILLLTIVFLLASCDTFTRKQSDDKIDAVRVIYSDAGGVSAIFTGDTSSCTIIADEGTPIKVEEMVFDASANTCTATVKTKED
jgi:hypothetical protein